MSELEYYQKIDVWVLEAINFGVQSFAELLAKLPGVDPIMAKLSLDRLLNSAESTDIEEILKKLALEIPASSLPRFYDSDVVPHPLDFDWRFTKESIKTFSEKIHAQNHYNKILLLGTPSLAEALEASSSKKYITLVDQNNCWGNRFNSVNFICADITSPNFMNALSFEYDLVIIDPPWYTKHFNAFMHLASYALRVGGSLLVASPAEGTRPGIAKERRELNIFGASIGLRFCEEEKGKISYETPPFEFNAFLASGINFFGGDWRRADLFSYEKVGSCELPSLHNAIELDWKEINIHGVRIKFKCINDESREITLNSILAGDILPSVSVRHPLRDKATIWTSGNRIFECSAPELLYQLLNTYRLDLPCASLSPNSLSALERMRAILKIEFDEYIHVDSGTMGWV